MKNRSLKFKVFLLFSFPLIAFIYFSYLFFNYEDKEINKISVFKLSSHVTSTLNSLLHNLQIERGLSAGYIVRENKLSYQNILTQQYTKTDKAYKKLIAITKLVSDDKDRLDKLIGYKAKPIIAKVLLEMSQINIMREEILNSKVSFEDEMRYYTKINKYLILTVKIFNTIFKDMQGDSIAIIKLQELTEYAGLERAYIYNQLLSNYKDKDIAYKLKEFQVKQDELIEQFFANSSKSSDKIYNDNYNLKIINMLNYCRDGIVNKALKSTEADMCFNASSQYINIFAQTSIEMLANYNKRVFAVHQESLHSLYFTILMWIISIIAIATLAYILKKLISTEEEIMQELRISSYAFNAQEAMVITNKEGEIIRINDSFTQITGYEEDEAIGKKTNLLRSPKHDDLFYKNMWNELLTFNTWQGEIYNQRKSGEIYPEMLSITAIKDDYDHTTHYIGQFLDISDIKEAKELAQHQADHDFLTGLFNRKSLIERLDEEFIKAKRHQLIHAFLFIDLDAFKRINDNYGHIVGDELIIETSKRIKSVLRQEDIAARISGDEFGIVVVNIGDNEKEAAKGVQHICKKILKEMSKEFIINEHTLHMSLSIGIKLFPENEKSVQDIIIHADKAMYEAKKQGKNRFVFFDTAIENELRKFTTLEKEIKESLKENNFLSYYQPKVDTKSGEIIGAELLVRWHHKTQGILYPDSFIKIAEEIGVIEQFTALALKNACNFIKQNKDKFHGKLAINISSQELLHPNFEYNITSLIEKYQVDPTRIELEITESIIIKEFDLVVKKIKNLQKTGISFSIDDFGTGYSSITYLQKLPVNVLKIDKSFLHDLDLESNKELIKMMANIAKTFKMKVVAEGIEDETMLEFIKDIGIDYYQGYYFSKAIEEQSFIDLL